MPPLSREAIFAVLSGLTAFACDKSTAARAEPAAVDAAPAASAAEVPAAAGSAKPAGSAGGKEKSCAPGGCAPGQCGANKP